jgi:Cu/Ag efflux pump CusA
MMNYEDEIQRCASSISGLVDEISKLQARVRKLEIHIHRQNVYKAGYTGEPVTQIKVQKYRGGKYDEK